MRHARPDYNRIQDPAGLIPDDEPVMLFRAQDVHAASVLDFYALLLRNGPEASGEMIELVEAQADRMRDWPTKKFPDLAKPSSTPA